MQKAIRCTLPSCRCECFSPGKNALRTCDSCKHGWVAHALDKLGYRSMYQLGLHVEIVQPNIVFDIASLMLYGAQATPIRLKILLDRLFSVLQHSEVLQVLHGFGWAYEDYARGYILQESGGRVLDKWTVATREEEQVILQQFLRFGETKSIAQEIILQDARENRDKQSMQAPKTESEIKKFIERSNVGMQSFMRGYDPRPIVGRSAYSPGIAASTAAAAAAAAHMLSPTASLKAFASSSSASGEPSRDTPVALTTKNSVNNPVTSSPLNRLQTMQPFDYRRERLSPTVSPSTSEKSLPTTGSSAESGSPQNLSVGASSSTHTSPPMQGTQPSHIVITPKPDALVIPKNEPRDDVKYPTADTDREVSSEGAINLTIKDSRYTTKESAAPAAGTSSYSPKEAINTSAANPAAPSLLYAEQKVKHLRKSSHPTKRPWTPTPGYGGTLISPSGKKRVLCTACNKTFCDKGALKIHYSAVHLKEMHKCSVEGCNMMFSSRRSRNRHSANPNPKLHMPQARRKLTENLGVYDERAEAMSLSPGSATQLSLSPQSLPMTSMSSLVLDPKSVMAPSAITGLMSPEKRYYLDPRAITPETLLGSSAKMARMESLDTEKEEAKMMPSQDVNTGRSSRKRKSMVPTRCAQTEEVFAASDDNTNDGMCYADSESEMDADGVRSPGSSGSLSHDDIVLEADERADIDSAADSSMQDEAGTATEPQHQQAESNNEPKTNDAETRPDTSDSKDISKDKPCEDVCKDESHDIKVQSAPQETASVGDESELQGEKKLPQSSNNALCDPVVGDLQCMESDEEDQEHDESMDCANGEESGAENGDVDIPLDKDNPKKCPSCNKVFMNTFTVRTHFQNVHLKLMHTCTVEGCNAAFPSKRSRDRHSSNLNLHRKLLSTSSEENNKVGAHSLINQNLRDEFLPRIYDSESYHLYGHQAEAKDEPVRDLSPQRASTPPMVGNNNNDSLAGDNNHTSDVDNSGGDSPQPDPDGSVTCHICNQPFRDNLVLKEHFEKLHPKEMYHCTIQGCDKIFSTRKSRNRHSQNDNLHRHLSPTSANGAV